MKDYASDPYKYIHPVQEAKRAASGWTKDAGD
jgi:hypothetical protein